MKPLRHEGPTFFSVFLRPRVVFGEETKTPKNFRFLQRNKIKTPLRPFSYHMAWKTGGREDILRRRPPDFCKLALIFFTLISVVQYTNGISCKLDEVKQHNSSTGVYHCIKCPVCPPGQGLDQECLNYKKLNESLKCETCKTGTFSDKNDTATCQPCQQCDGLKTLKSCTKTENTQCSKDCKDGFKLEKVFGIQMCLSYTKKPRTSSHKPKIHLYTNGELPTPPNVDSAKKRSAKSRTKSTQKSITAIKDDEKTKTPSVNNQAQEGEKKEPNVFTIIISIFLLISFTFILVYGVKKREKIWRFICHLYCSCRRGSDQHLNEATPMNPDEQELKEIISVPMNQQREVTPNLADQRLKDISHILRGKIVLEISKKQLGLKGWQEIGEMCNISKIELNGMATTSYYSCGSKFPGECLLEFLEASKPELTLVKFIEMLRSLEREDVILLINEEISKRSVTVS